MQEFVKKLIDRLEAEQKYQYEKAEEADKKINLEMISISEARRKSGQCFDVAIQVIEQLAEEYNNEMSDCEHRWIFKEAQHKTTVSGYENYTAHYHRIDVFFCEKCCEINKIEQQEDVSLPFGGIRNLSKHAPIWYQPKGE